MPIQYDGNKAVFKDIVTVEEAESLVQWLQDQQKPEIDVSQCEHMHSACLQALLVFLGKEEICQRLSL